jgi:GNAT superfamily N-acetyltransferase
VATGVSQPLLVIEDPPDPRDVAELERLVAESLLSSRPEDSAGSAGSEGSEFTTLFRHDGKTAGGVYGIVFGRTCELQHLFVRSEHRRRGMGRRIMEVAEGEAARRGCTQLVLFTHASLGERFYPRLGYTLLARVDDYPDGDAALWFRKDIRPATAEPEA